MDSPLRVTLYDKDLIRTGWCEDFVEHHVFPRHLALGDATLIVPTDYRKLDALAEDGARAVVELERDGKVETVLSGKVRLYDAQGPSRTGLTTFGIEDDYRVIYNLLGYPSPATWQPDANGVLTQAAKSDDRTGPAETVVKGYLAANLARWAGRALPYTVAPSLGRGANIEASLRMQPLAEKLHPLLANAGVGFTVRQRTLDVDGVADLYVDAYATGLFPLDLSEDGGTVETWKLTRNPYTSTAAIGGGPNAGTSREFRIVIDAVREGRYRDVIETFVDASDQTIASKILAKISDELKGLGDKHAVELTLSESSVFRYGGEDGVHRGDQVSVDFPGESLGSITAIINEAELAFTREEGYTAKFTVGQANADADDMIADLLQQLIAAVHEIRSQ